MITALHAGPAGARDAALLLVGFAAAVRRSELIALDIADLEHRHEGLVVTLRRSKTDQDGTGRQIGLPHGSNPATCPVRNLRTWLELADISDGPLFRPIDRHGRIDTGASPPPPPTASCNGPSAAPASTPGRIPRTRCGPVSPPPPPKPASLNGPS